MMKISVKKLSNEQRKEYGWFKLDLNFTFFGYNLFSFNSKKKINKL
jgi:hypothetical protein